MTMNSLLQLVLAAADDTDRVFDHREISTWQPGSLETLCRLGLLREAATGLYAPCPNCDDGHVEPVIIRAGTGDAKRYFISCPAALRVEVQPGMCNGWEVDRGGLAAAVATALGITSTPKLVVPERFWQLGRTPWPPGSGQTREIVLAVRMHDQDARAIAAHVGRGGRAIVLVPQHAPADRLWPGRAPAVAVMSQIMAIDGNHLVIDSMALCELVVAADHHSSERAGLSLDALSAKKVRRHVDAVIESKVANEGLVQAYRTHGSYRKAADALNAAGYVTDRWAVERAVKAAGGTKVVMRQGDSVSVGRTVASQCGDRAKKFLERR